MQDEAASASRRGRRLFYDSVLPQSLAVTELENRMGLDATHLGMNSSSNIRRLRVVPALNEDGSPRFATFRNNVEINAAARVIKEFGVHLKRAAAPRLSLGERRVFRSPESAAYLGLPASAQLGCLENLARLGEAVVIHRLL